MRQEKDIDRILQYGLNEIDNSIKVVNRENSNLTYRLKKLRERIARRQAKLYVLLEINISDEMEQPGKNIQKQILLSIDIELFKAKDKDIISQRSQQPY